MKRKLSDSDQNHECHAVNDYSGQPFDLFAIPETIHGQERRTGEPCGHNERAVRLCALERGEDSKLSMSPEQHREPQKRRSAVRTMLRLFGPASTRTNREIVHQVRAIKPSIVAGDPAPPNPGKVK